MEREQLHLGSSRDSDGDKAMMRPTEADVHWCYRNILTRRPESEEIVKKHLMRNRDFGSLVLSFINAPEFRGRSTGAGLVPLGHPGLDVEWEASPAQIRDITERIKKAWTHMGLNRPYHSVLSSVDNLPENFDEEKEERFWKSGRTEAAGAESVLARYKFTDLNHKICVEYGCGLGRVTVVLSELFKTIHAYDISPTHLTRAEQHARAKGARNIQFHVSGMMDDGIEIEECDFFYSRLVIQHNPPPLMRELIKVALASLRSGGVAMFQLPTYAPGYRFRVDEYLARTPSLDMEMHCLPQSVVFQLVRDAGCGILEVREDGSIGRVGQWISNTFIVQKL